MGNIWSSRSAFAAPCACFCDNLRRFFDSLECNQATHTLLHMRKGRSQLETFLTMQHGGATSFEQELEKYSLVWKDHVDQAKKNENLGVQTRPFLPELLPGLQHVYDIRVGSPGKPDDAVYLEDEYARKWLPRGNCVAAWTNRGTTYFFPLVRGLRKFTGQEDDGKLAKKVENEKLSKFFTKPQFQSKWVISTTKENGDAGHLAVLKKDDGKFVYVLGSKNTHIMAQTIDDIKLTREINDKSDGNDVFYSAAPIATAILRMLFALEPAKQELLCEFLWQTRATASFEVLFLNHQHVQLLDYLSEDTPVFYGLSLMTLNPLEGAEICVNPVLVYEFMRALGVRTVAYEIIEVDRSNMDVVSKRCKNIYQVEGCVHLFLDDDAAVIGMQKYKSIWYVSLRAIREKAKTFCLRLISKKPKKGRAKPLTPEEVLKLGMDSVQNCFRAIRQNLQISKKATSAYKALGQQFLKYLFEDLFHGSAAEIDHDKKCKQIAREVSDLFPVIWKRFLTHTGASDVVPHD